MYIKYQGTPSYKNEHGQFICPHQKTTLKSHGDCLICPAHGLKFQKPPDDCSPSFTFSYFTPPFYIINNQVKIKLNKKLIGKKFDKGRYKLVDSNNKKIMKFNSIINSCRFDPWPLIGVCPDLIQDVSYRINNENK